MKDIFSYGDLDSAFFMHSFGSMLELIAGFILLATTSTVSTANFGTEAYIVNPETGAKFYYIVESHPGYIGIGLTLLMIGFLFQLCGSLLERKVHTMYIGLIVFVTITGFVIGNIA